MLASISGIKENLVAKASARMESVAQKGISATVAQDLNEISDEMIRALVSKDSSARIGIGMTIIPASRMKGAAEKMAEALKLESAGTSVEDIWKKTGIFRDPVDLQLKAEISDAKAKILPQRAFFRGNLDQYLDHPELFEAIPELRKTYVKADKGRFSGSAGNDRIEVKVAADNPLGAKQVTLHEVNHDIQQKFGFTEGSSPEREMRLIKEEAIAKDPGRHFGTDDILDALDEANTRYLNNPAEMASRAVETRMNWPDVSRANVSPLKTMEAVKDRGRVNIFENGGGIPEGYTGDDVIAYLRQLAGHE